MSCSFLLIAATSTTDPDPVRGKERTDQEIEAGDKLYLARNRINVPRHPYDFPYESMSQSYQPHPLKIKGMEINKYRSLFTKNQSRLSITSQRKGATSLLKPPRW